MLGRARQQQAAARWAGERRQAARKCGRARRRASPVPRPSRPPCPLAQIFISDSSLEITSFALSLLLVFRTDSRWGRASGGRGLGGAGGIGAGTRAQQAAVTDLSNNPALAPHSYSRWEQAMDAWEHVRSETKNLARQVGGAQGP
jgi:predicted membrane chloride channel (bestrophin family)